MKVIATHINADFDGFAAMIGLLKLHPDAMLVFPGAKEPGLRQFLKETPMDIPEIAVKEVKDMTHLILVDAGREDRLGSLAAALQQTPRPFIEIYDHHPERQVSIQADRYHVHRYGSTTTIVGLEMMERFEEGNAPLLSSLQASVMLAGIYEDTANFLSSGTTAEDLRVALFLLDRGAEINVVNRIQTHRLRPDQVDFFNTMVSHCESSNVAGRVVVISSFSWPVFVPEAAYLVHRLMDLEPIDVFFALIQMENRVHMIARSLAPDVDVGRIAEELGGGGHTMAASAVLKGMTLIEAREKLFAVLHQNLQRREKASDLMKPNVITIELTKTLSEAAELMNRHRINTLAVTEENVAGGTATPQARIVGTITRQVVDGAVFHGLQDRLVQEYMGTEIPLVDPDTSARDVFERMISGRNRFVLVGRDPASVRGIITRMDLLRLHYESMFPAPSLKKGKQSENLQPMLKKRLPERVNRLLEESGSVAERIGYKMYLVGGMVRDLLLHRENMDLDLVVEGDGIRFAEEFGKIHNCQVATHARFGTARLIFPDRFKLDVATARTESYHEPAALPQVVGGILRQDLYRRDFTINTLAIDLSPRRFGMLIDYFGGWDDLHHGVIRVLHSLSFIDDPTRTLRAVRFATRFNFRISKDTERLIHSAVESNVLEKLSGKRFWTELRNILQEDHPIPSIRMLHQYKLLPFVHPQIALDGFLLDLLYQVQSVLAWFHLNFPRERPAAWLLYLMALLEKLDRSERLLVAQRFQFTAPAQESLKKYKTDTKDIRTRLLGSEELKPSALYFSLSDYSLEILLYAMARLSEEGIRQQIARYLNDLRGQKLLIKGDDILALGVPPGPIVKEILDEVLKAKLDGQTAARQEQLQLASRLATEVATGKFHS